MKLQEGDTERVLTVIGSRIRKIRQSKDNNYEKFAENHKINKVTLLRIENGQDFKMKNLIKILCALEVQFNELFQELDSEIALELFFRDD